MSSLDDYKSGDIIKSSENDYGIIFIKDNTEKGIIWLDKQFGEQFKESCYLLKDHLGFDTRFKVVANIDADILTKELDKIDN